MQGRGGDRKKVVIAHVPHFEMARGTNDQTMVSG